MIDIAIIGAGPAGLTAGLYAARAGLNAVVLEQLFAGGQAATTSTIENYPGVESVEGPELAMRMEAQARSFGLSIRYDTVESLSLSESVKTIHTSGGIIQARAVILCMGATPRLLGVPGEDRLRGRGVSYCATCDGALYRGKRVAVVGGGDTAAEDALFLSSLAGEVHWIHRRDALRAAKVVGERALNADTVLPHWNTVVTQVQGDSAVQSITLQNTATNETADLAVDAIFVAVGVEPKVDLVREQIALSPQGYILAGEDGRTSLPFVYAAGDIRQKPLRQIVTATADGANALYSAQADLLGIA